MVCDDYLYTFYVQEYEAPDQDELIQACTLEKFHIETLQSTLIIDQHDFKVPLTVEEQKYFLRENPNLFVLQHYGLVEDDEFVTDYFLNAQNSLFEQE